MACTLAPAITPLCAIGVAIAIALAQLWPGPAWIVRREAQRHGRHVPGDVADVVRPAAALLLVGHRLAPAQLSNLGREPDLRHLQLSLQRLGQRDVGVGPLRQPDRGDVLVHRLGQRAIHVRRPRRSEHARLTVVSVIIAAPLAMLSPISHMRLMPSYDVSRK